MNDVIICICIALVGVACAFALEIIGLRRGDKDIATGYVKVKVTLLKKFLSRNLMAIMVVVLVLSQGLLFSFVYMSRQAQEYTTEVEQLAFEKGQKFTIANIPERKKQKVKSKLFSLAHKNNLAILRISSLSNDRGIQVSIYGEIQRNADNFDYEFFGKKYLIPRNCKNY